ncbi:hypothetical protein LZK98_09405 [Sphingomonas cannabina]|uniref:hypothetical protein n=1 Tax=Sphingomonas cannabina TaxID=2899123 RepID=UPI001F1E6562|nr:hypothetical protein [Sphingomonas cannabina]UIJ47134.1 hypothetical protein LZK98_09405 [Sphingomonas cannabina]
MRTVSIEAIAAQRFDLAILTCGYETRAAYLRKSIALDAAELVVLDYRCDTILSYDENKAFYESLSNRRFIDIDDSLSEKLSTALSKAAAGIDAGNRLRILIDISSCSRSVMAKLLLAIAETLPGSVELTCAYALSAFDNPPDGELPSHISEPVVGDLSGWSDDLSKPPCAVIGMGFEPGRALGCMDYLEIPEVRLFMPYGVDQRFEQAVQEANAVLIAEAGTQSVLPYQILDPAATYEKMESLIYGLLARFRPVIIPLGPKIFAALAMVLAVRMLPRICVWRTSSGTIGGISDRTANGEVAIFTTEF